MVQEAVALGPNASGSRMPPPHGQWETRIADLERDLAAEKKKREALEIRVNPVIDFFNASSLLGRILWVLGAAAGVAATVWAATRK
jgi:hypothetical protein